MREKFGAVLDAFEYGAPPHGGIALGIDRWAALLADQTNIREVMAFPKTQSGTRPDARGAVAARAGPVRGARAAVRRACRARRQRPTPAERGADRPPILDAIGHTPAVRLSRLVEPGMAEIWIKLESNNPTGSYKDRMALAMIEGAERSGRLRARPDGRRVHRGQHRQLARLVCSIKGYPLRIVSSDAFAAEKILTMRAFGADVELIPSPAGITPSSSPRCAPGRRRSPPRSTATRPTSSTTTTWSTATGRSATSWRSALGDRLDAWTNYVGTAGCFLGVTAALRARIPDLERVIVEPAESAVYSGRAPSGTHRIEGGGVGFVAPQMAPGDWDSVEVVSTDEAFAMARRAAREEGLWSGPSTGANIVAALRIARRLGEGRRVATVLVDSGLKYLGGELFR